MKILPVALAVIIGAGAFVPAEANGYRRRSYKSLIRSYVRSKQRSYIRNPYRPRNTIRRKSKRNYAIRNRFRRMTGHPKGRPGYEVDHITPLCAGGADATYNMQWLSVSAHKHKTRNDVRRCRRGF